MSISQNKISLHCKKSRFALRSLNSQDKRLYYLQKQTAKLSFHFIYFKSSFYWF